ncbi:hypothetical protein GPALN_006872 [Globodera pallida]|nr:hypothetical protein GPALN_006872 [Globodera pallida]
MSILSLPHCCAARTSTKRKAEPVNANTWVFTTTATIAACCDAYTLLLHRLAPFEETGTAPANIAGCQHFKNKTF